MVPITPRLTLLAGLGIAVIAVLVVLSSRGPDHLDRPDRSSPAPVEIGATFVPAGGDGSALAQNLPETESAARTKERDPGSAETSEDGGSELTPEQESAFRQFQDLLAGESGSEGGHDKGQVQLADAAGLDPKWDEEDFAVRIDDYGNVVAPNPAQGFEADFSRFARHGVRVRDRMGQELSVRLTAMGGGSGSMAPVNESTGEPRVGGERIEFYRADGISEWFVNTEEGLEQGWTIERPPEQSAENGQLRLDLALASPGARAELKGPKRNARSAGQSLVFTDRRGRETWAYDKLQVFDSRGRELQSRMELSGRSSRDRIELSLLVDTVGARYPLTIDPLISTRLANFDISSGGSDPQSLTEYGGRIYFGARGADSFDQIWSTDGTTEGTRLVKDLNGTFSEPTGFVEAGGLLFFAADTPAEFGSTGHELWCTDGTKAGTRMVKEIAPGLAYATPRELTAFNGQLFFQASNGIETELWRSNGTEEGTVLVKDIDIGQSSWPTELTVVGNQLFFTATDRSVGRELWVTDGTTVGTRLVKDVFPGSTGSLSGNELAELGGKVYFLAVDRLYGQFDDRDYKLWVSDGTEGGTTVVKDLMEAEFPGDPHLLTRAGNRLFFVHEDDVAGEEVWVSDGTELGTILLKDINPGFYQTTLFGSNPSALREADGNLYFLADDGGSGDGLWTSDGTEVGTVFVSDEIPIDFLLEGGVYYFGGGGGLSTSDGTPGNTSLLKSIFISSGFVSFNGVVLFAADDGINGRELWITDGTSGGTTLVRNISTPYSGSLYTRPAEMGGDFFFSSYRRDTGIELWATDGTSGGTRLVKDINPGELDSYPTFLTNAGGRLFFFAQSSGSGTELWTSDGTESGTLLVKDIAPGSSNGIQLQFPGVAAAIGSLFYFSAEEPGGGGLELWRSDGTEGGTEMLKDINPGNADSQPQSFQQAGMNHFFFANDGTNGFELWATDGTAGNTRLVKDINPGASKSLPPKPMQAIALGSRLIFSADNGTDGIRLWTSDGSTGGTVQLGDFDPTPGNVSVAGHVVFDGQLYIRGTDGSGPGLWRTDGTPGGTALVARVNPASLIVALGHLFFIHNSEVWTSDGTALGTVLFKSIDVDYIVEAGSGLLLAKETTGAYDLSASHADLWVSDGTSDGTIKVDGVSAVTFFIGLGSFSGYASFPTTELDGRVFFQATDGERGYELWSSDGTVGGTVLAEDILEGVPSSFPGELWPFGDALFFSAASPTGGRDFRLYKSPPPVIINEIDSVSTPSNTQEFIELFDGGSGNTDLSDITLVLFDGSSDTSYRTVDLTGQSTDGNGYFVIGASGTPNVDLVISDGALNDGPAAVGLFQDSAASFPNGTPVTTAKLIDSVVYDNGSPDDAGLLVLLNGNEPQLNEDEFSTAASTSLQRLSNGSGGRFNTNAYTHLAPTPGGENIPPSPPATPVLLSSSDTGISNADRITMDTTPTIRISTVPGALVALTSDVDGVVGTLSANGAGDADITTTSLSEGGHILTATANGSVPSSALSVEIDVTPPAAPGAPDLLAGSDSGSSSTDNLTNVTTPGFAGSAPAGVSEVVLCDGGSSVGTDGPNPGTTWSITSASLSSGAHTITAKARDIAGNESALSPALGIEIDTASPTVTINQKSGEPDPAAGGPLAFTAVFNEPVTGFSSGDVSVTGSLVGSVTSVSENSPGNFTVSVSPNAGEGTVFASIPGGAATDLAGNSSLASTSSDNRYTIDIFESSSGTPSPIVLTEGDGSKRGYLTPGDEDAFTFTLSLDAPVVVYTTGTTDTRGEILDSSSSVQNNPGSDDNAGTGSNFRSPMNLTAGTYTVKVTANSGEGDYELHIEADLPFLQPDLVIGSLGDGTYGETASQTRRLVSRKARPVRTTVTLQNDGDVTDSYTVRSTRGNRLFRVICSSQDGNVSAALFAGNLEVSNLAAGTETYPIAITIKPNKRKLTKVKRTKRGKKTSYLKKTFTQILTATSNTLATQADSIAVRVQTR